MIVITEKVEKKFYVRPGDSFCLTVGDDFGCKVVIEEEITVAKVIDFAASFRFALEDGTCPGFHLMGILASNDSLPEEIKNAVMFEDLPKEKKKRFADSCGVDLSPRKGFF